jgi:hypothetical protein
MRGVIIYFLGVKGSPKCRRIFDSFEKFNGEGFFTILHANIGHNMDVVSISIRSFGRVL